MKKFYLFAALLLGMALAGLGQCSSFAQNPVITFKDATVYNATINCGTCEARFTKTACTNADSFVAAIGKIMFKENYN